MMTSEKKIGRSTSSAASRIVSRTDSPAGSGVRVLPPRVEGVHDVLDHHQRAVDDDAEVERAEAQQVRRNAA